jgi:hypothetical protein
MYLALLLIVIAIIVFYNEYNSKMGYGEICLLGITLVVIIRAAINYLKINTTVEGFTSGRNDVQKKRFDRNHNHTNDNDLTEIMDKQVKREARNHNDEYVLESKQSKEYLDTAESVNNFNNIKNDNQDSDPDALKNQNEIDTNAVTQVNSLFKSKETFNDDQNENNIKSFFSPQIIIGDKTKQTPAITKPDTNSRDRRSAESSDDSSSYSNYLNSSKNGNETGGSTGYNPSDGMTFEIQ